MTIDEAIKHCEEVVEQFEKVKRIKAVTHEDYRCAENHIQLAKWLKELKYARTLLKATHELLCKCDDSSYVLNVLEQTTVYDGVECDGYCLMEDIWFLMEEWEDD